MIRDSIRLLCVTLGVPFLLASRDCKILTVDNAIRNARKLDGKIICLKGMLRPIPDSRGSGAFIREITPSSAGTRSAGRAIGIMEWGPESGINETQYKPDSFRLIDEKVLGQQAPDEPVEVVFRGAIMYEKGFFKRLDALLPPGDLYDSLRGLSYSVEFVMLEVVSAKAIKRQ